MQLMTNRVFKLLRPGNRTMSEKKHLLCIGAIGLSVSHTEEPSLEVGINGRGYDIALALLAIHENAAFCTASNEGSFSDFILMDAEESSLVLWAERFGGAGLSGTVNFRSVAGNAEILHHAPVFSRGISVDLLRKSMESAQAVIIEAAFDQEMLQQVAEMATERNIPLFVVVRRRAEIRHLSALPDHAGAHVLVAPMEATLTSGAWKDLPGVEDVLYFSSVGQMTVFDSEGESIQKILDGHLTEQDFSRFCAATIAQAVQWKRTLRQASEECKQGFLDMHGVVVFNAANSMERKFDRYFRTVENMDRDILTGLPTRVPVEKKLDDATRSDTPFSVISIGVDHLSEVNVSMGYIEGDRTLTAVSRLLSVTAGEGNVLGRWNGSEFLAIIYSAGINDAWRMAEILRRTIEAANIHGIFVSCGVATPQADESWKDAISRAFDNLNFARSLGGNQVGMRL